ncbi:signal peptidase I [Lacipirellula parvula]|uniref:Signal peptidase I n=1 Tax=Lacipirellula parvula TaxID=2650471 RepID=A0A5K7X4N3_9BACT|nr:signal peptidase I [Lacipirellula parvula]BBO31500.1 signal peptidase I [Lacipirellula parvula]
MTKAKTPVDRRETPEATAPAKVQAEAKSSHDFVMFRETLESIVVAFVLAFLFRTFEAEAFVIPTGSMSPSLQGQHKDVNCNECGHRFRTTASVEGDETDKAKANERQLEAQLDAGQRELSAARSSGHQRRAADIQRQLDYLTNELTRVRQHIKNIEVVGGMCPMCRNLMPMRPDLPKNVAEDFSGEEIELQPSYPGDRILVNKYGVDFSEPERWDVVVFKFPGDGNMNYIKRLVGLPGEEIRIYQGDIFVKPIDAAESEYQISRRPAEKVAAMLELIHDSDYESATLYNAGWPLRWAATTPDGWQVDAKVDGKNVVQRFSIDQSASDPLAWLRYRHITPNEGNWEYARRLAKDGSDKTMLEEAEKAGISRGEWDARLRANEIPKLITDFNPYNASLQRYEAEGRGWQLGANSMHQGTEWVGDLAIDATVEVEEARGQLMLDLVEAGNHFRATFNLADGKVELTAVDARTGEALDFKATGQTSVNAAGTYELRFANVDDQLLLWIDGELVDLGDTTYDPDKLLPTGRKGMIPWASANADEDQGDLAPAGVGALDAKLTVTRLALLRDIYYIAIKAGTDSRAMVDFESTVPMDELFAQPDRWGVFAGRRKRDFKVEEGQLFVLGDNSPASKDCRLWKEAENGAEPGGPYLDRNLLIGKAVAVFWPHSWGTYPFSEKLPILKAIPGWPAFGDMRKVR